MQAHVIICIFMGVGINYLIQWMSAPRSIAAVVVASVIVLLLATYECVTDKVAHCIVVMVRWTDMICG